MLTKAAYVFGKLKLIAGEGAAGGGLPILAAVLLDLAF